MLNSAFQLSFLLYHNPTSPRCMLVKTGGKFGAKQADFNKYALFLCSNQSTASHNRSTASHNRSTVSPRIQGRKTVSTPVTRMRITFYSGTGLTWNLWHWKLDSKGFLYSCYIIGFRIFIRIKKGPKSGCQKNLLVLNQFLQNFET